MHRIIMKYSNISLFLPVCYEKKPPSESKLKKVSKEKLFRWVQKRALNIK